MRQGHRDAHFEVGGRGKFILRPLHSVNAAASLMSSYHLKRFRRADRRLRGDAGSLGSRSGTLPYRLRFSAFRFTVTSCAISIWQPVDDAYARSADFREFYERYASCPGAVRWHGAPLMAMSTG